MEYLIELHSRYAVGDDKFKTHKSYFYKVGTLLPVPNFGSKDKAMRFDNKKDAMEKLHEIGGKQGDRYKIVTF